MANRFFQNIQNLLSFTKARARDVEGELTSVEAGFDQVQTELDAAMRAPNGETLARLPAAALRANKAILFDATGLSPGVATVLAEGQVTTVLNAAAAAAAAATAASLTATTAADVAAAQGHSDAAALSAADAAASALAASGAPVWVSGTTYAIGNVVRSPSSLKPFVRKTNGAGTTDPQSDPTNWRLLFVESLTAKRLFFATF